MTHDVCGPGTFGIFQKEFGMNAQARCCPLRALLRALRALRRGCGRPCHTLLTPPHPLQLPTKNPATLTPNIKTP
jgi:hypothetical protein